MRPVKEMIAYINSQLDYDATVKAEMIKRIQEGDHNLRVILSYKISNQ